MRTKPNFEYPGVPSLQDVRRFISDGSGLPLDLVRPADKTRPAAEEKFCTVLEVRDFQVGQDGETRRSEFSQLSSKIREQRVGGADSAVPAHLLNLRGIINGKLRFTRGEGGRQRTFQIEGIVTSIRSTYTSIAAILEERMRRNPRLNDVEVFFDNDRFRFWFPRGGDVEFIPVGIPIDLGGDDYLGVIEGGDQSSDVIMDVGSGDVRYDYTINRLAVISAQFFRDSEDRAHAFALWVQSELSQQAQNLYNFKVQGRVSTHNSDAVNDSTWEGRRIVTFNVAYIDELRQAVGRIDTVDIVTQRDLVPPPVQEFTTQTNRDDPPLGVL